MSARGPRRRRTGCAAILDAGLDPDQLAELGRTIAVAMSQFAAASRQVVGRRSSATVAPRTRSPTASQQGAGGLIPTVGPDPRLRLPPAPPRAAPPRRLRRGCRRHRSAALPGRGHDRDRLRRPRRLHEARRAAPAGGARPGHRPPRGGRAGGRQRPGPPRQADRRRGDARLRRHRRAARVDARARRRDGRGGGGRGLPADPGRASPTGRRSPAAATTTGGRSTWRAGSPRRRGRAACSSPPRSATTSTRRRSPVLARRPQAPEGDLRLGRAVTAVAARGPATRTRTRRTEAGGLSRACAPRRRGCRRARAAGAARAGRCRRRCSDEVAAEGEAAASGRGSPRASAVDSTVRSHQP